MNWIGALAETYDACIKYDAYRQGQIPLIPIAHTTVMAAIEITLSMDGQFIRANVVPYDNQETIIPGSESAIGRTSGMCAYPLCDKLVYLCPHIEEWLIEKGQKEKKILQSGYNLYMKEISDWADSEYGCSKIRAIRNYVSKGTVLTDLLNDGVVFSDADYVLLSPKDISDSKLVVEGKISGNQSGIFVRWRVDDPNDTIKDIWADPTIQKSWIMYYSSHEKVDSSGLCYVSGEVVPLSVNHPSKIRNSGDKAKLICQSNNRLAYFGRFVTSEQACGVGYDVSQKAHNALRWLIKRQGYVEGDFAFVAWNTNGDDVPDGCRPNYDIFGTDDIPPLQNSDVSIRINNYLRGYNSKLGNEKVMAIAVDSAVPGRLAMLMFREFIGSDFISILGSWYTSLAWRHSYGRKKNEDGEVVQFKFIGAPTPRDIARVVLGEGAKNDEIRDIVKRILPCIFDGSQIPKDITEAVIRRASNPMSQNKYSHDMALTIACSLYKRQSGGRFDMVLDRQNSDRDYLYGRLLAIADLLESEALDISGEKRQTNAMRLMQRFSEFPYSTWSILEPSLNPYRCRLRPGRQMYYDKLIGEVMDLFVLDDFKNNRKLSGEYLIGFHCQKENHFRKKDEESMED